VVPDACSTTSKAVHDASPASLGMFAEIVSGSSLLAALDGDTQQFVRS
jgi:hypothetical protein